MPKHYEFKIAGYYLYFTIIKYKSNSDSSSTP